MKRLKILSHLWNPFTRTSIPLHAAASVFYLILSSIPASILLLSLLPILPIDRQFFELVSDNFLPQTFHPQLSSILDFAYSRTTPVITSFSAITMLWSSSKGILSLMDGANAAMEITPIYGYFKRKLSSLICYVLLIVSILLSMIGVVITTSLLEKVFSNFHEHVSFYHFVLLKTSVSLLTLTLILTCIFHLLPYQKLPFKLCLYSALLTSIGWIIVSQLFRTYIKFFLKHSIYGSFGFLIGIFVWLYISVILILCGIRYGKLKSDGTYKPVRIIQLLFSKNN